MDPIAVIQALGETVATAPREAPDSCVQGGILDALAILSCVVRRASCVGRGRMEARFHPGL